MAEQLNFRGLEICLTRRNTKALRLSIKPTGKITLSVPLRTSKKEIEKFLVARLDWIYTKQQEILSQPMAQAEHASKQEQNEWKQVLEACVPPLIEEWSAILGVEVKTLAFRNMKSRWGSCQPSTGRVCINTRLALYPPECLEYVVVHELCHFFEQNHGRGFYVLMDKVMPDWKARKAKLR